VVARDLYDHGPSAVAGQAAASASTFGWGAGLSGHFIRVAKDGIYFQANGGYGIGRYATDSGTAPGDSVISADGKTLKTARGAPEAAAAGRRVASGSIPVAAC